MYCYRHAVDLFSIGSSIFSRGAIRNSILRSQGAMNFLFVRIYKSANLDYLDDHHLEESKMSKILARNLENSFVSNTLFLFYLHKKELFNLFLKQLFTYKTQLQKISQYLGWRRLSEAGLFNPGLSVTDSEGSNYFCGRVLSDPVVHKYEIFEKK